MRHSAGAPVRGSGDAGGPPPGRRRGGGRDRRAATATSPARPGGARAEQLPYWITIGSVAVLLVLTWQRALSIRGGTLAVAGIVLAAALARMALPERRAGMLTSRRRLVDVAILTALGAGLLVAGLVLPPQP